MVDVDKNDPSWQISLILTRHAAGVDEAPRCAKVTVLRNTRGRPAAERLDLARTQECTCGVGQ